MINSKLQLNCLAKTCCSFDIVDLADYSITSTVTVHLVTPQDAK